jgi:hypothetical protein
MTDWLVRSAREGQLGRAAPTVRAELTVRADLAVRAVPMAATGAAVPMAATGAAVPMAATGAAVPMVLPACPDWRACRALPVSLEPPAAVVRPVRRALLEMLA